MSTVFHFSAFYSTIGFLVILSLIILLMAASINTLKEYKEARIALIEGILTSQKAKEENDKTNASSGK